MIRIDLVRVLSRRRWSILATDSAAAGGRMISQRGQQVRALDGRRRQPLIWRKAYAVGVLAYVFGSASGYTVSISDTIAEPEVAAVRRHMMDVHAVRGLAWCCEARCSEAAGLLHPPVGEAAEALEAV
jgi:hypothetical protein